MEKLIGRLTPIHSTWLISFPPVWQRREPKDRDIRPASTTAGLNIKTHWTLSCRKRKRPCGGSMGYPCGPILLPSQTPKHSRLSIRSSLWYPAVFFHCILRCIYSLASPDCLLPLLCLTNHQIISLSVRRDHSRSKVRKLLVFGEGGKPILQVPTLLSSRKREGSWHFETFLFSEQRPTELRAVGSLSEVSSRFLDQRFWILWMAFFILESFLFEISELTVERRLINRHCYSFARAVGMKEWYFDSPQIALPQRHRNI